jgi:hypothetical protein
MRLASLIAALSACTLPAPMLAAPGDNPPPGLLAKIQIATQPNQGGPREQHIDVLSYSWGTSRAGRRTLPAFEPQLKSQPVVGPIYNSEPGSSEKLTVHGNRTEKSGDPDRPIVAGRVPNRRGTASVPETGDEVMVGMEHGDAASGQATGKRQHKPITFTKEWGAATPQIMKLDRPAAKGSIWIRTSQPWPACRVGARYPSLELGGGGKRYVLQDVTVASCGGSRSADGQPTEEVAFYYNRIAFNYAN